MSLRVITVRRTAPVLAAGMLLLAAGAAGAAVPVEESTPSRGGQQPAQGQPGASGSGGADATVDARAMDQAQGGGDAGRLSQLFYQIQVLQQEVQQLRGMVEEQSYQLERLARDQQEQYLDLDRRMQALREGAGQARVASPSGQADGAATASGDRSGGAPAGAAGSEREAYASAFELMRQRQFEASAQAFEALIQDYPNGAYTPNAFYWLGELHLAQDELEPARQSFVQVVNLYPDHQKVPDALYKLGVTYHRLGDVERARQYLNRVRSDYPQSSAAGLAQTYLAEL